MVKMNGCAAIDSVRPFRFWADKAAVAADFHSENGACYYEKRRIASKSGEYPHRSLPFRQAMHGGTHSCVLQNFSRAYLLQNLVGKHPKPFNNFKGIGCAPTELNINLSSESESGIFRLTAFRHIRFFLISVDRHLAKVSAHILYPKLRHPRLYQAEFFFIYEEFDLYRSLAIPVVWHRDSSLLLRIISNQNRSIIDMQFCVLLQNHA